MRFAAVEKFLHKTVRVRRGGAANPCSALIEIDSATYKVDWNRTEETVDGVSAAAEFGGSASGQQSESQFPQERQTPFVVRETSSRFALGQTLCADAEFRPVLPQPVPRLRNDIVETLALR